MSEGSIQPVTLTIGGVSASIDDEARVLDVAPTLEEKSNTIRRELRPIGCWRANDVRFEFDSSFPRPELRSELRVLERRLAAHEGCLLTVFGHADPVGNDEYNKGLSGRRSQAIYALLTRRVDLWEDLFNADKSWGDRGVARMVESVHTEESDDDSDDDSDSGSQTLADRLKAFQRSEGLGQSGSADKATRTRLFELYMDHLCIDINDDAWKLPPERFLGKGADSKGKADFQGCSEYNPVLLLSQSELNKFAGDPDKTERNAANAPNRRVHVLLFPADLEVDAAAWPCPRASEGTAGCKKRLWSDHVRRRQAGAERREFKETFDTFACRFYQRIAGITPCEREPQVPTMVIRIQLHDYAYKPCPEIRYRLLLETGEEIIGFTDGDGRLTERAPIAEQEVRVFYRPKEEDHDLESRAFISPDPKEDEEWVRRNARSFGFSPAEENPAKNDPVVLFQGAHRELEITGEPDDTTKDAVKKMLDEDLETDLGGE